MDECSHRCLPAGRPNEPSRGAFYMDDNRNNIGSDPWRYSSRSRNVCSGLPYWGDLSVADNLTISNAIEGLFVLMGSGYGLNMLHSRLSPSRRAKANGNQIVGQITAALAVATNEISESFYKAQREILVTRLDTLLKILTENNKMLGEFLAAEKARREEEIKRLLQRKGD